jgi:hypothetical protein
MPALLAIALSVCLAAPAFAMLVNGVGLIDFRKKNFKVGDWVRYRVETNNSNGLSSSNLQDIAVVGEETFRGEPCFWVETWFGKDSSKAGYDLTLVSARAFGDAQADVRFSAYIRLMMSDTDDEGNPIMTEVRHPQGSPELPDLKSVRGQVDTVGTEAVTTTGGSFAAQLVKLHRKLLNPREMPDSTVNRITDLQRSSWMSRKIPVTSLAKTEETENWFMQKYKAGEVSTSAPEVMVSSETRTAELVAWGSGRKSMLLPLWLKKKVSPTAQPGLPGSDHPR